MMANVVIENPFKDHEAIAQQLKDAGWRDLCDGQWERLKLWCDGMAAKWDAAHTARD